MFSTVAVSQSAFASGYAEDWEEIAYISLFEANLVPVLSARRACS